MDELINKVFGRVKVKGYLPKNYLNCVCMDCGKQLKIRKDGIKGSHHKKRVGGCRSCTRKSKKLDHVGEVYGQWRITRESTNYRWKVECMQCGITRLKQLEEIKAKHQCSNCMPAPSGEKASNWNPNREQVPGTPEWYDQHVLSFLDSKKKGKGILYIIQKDLLIKIGKTTIKNIPIRFKELERSYGRFKKLRLWRGPERFIYALEHNCHRRFKEFQQKIITKTRLDGRTEWFNLKCFEKVTKYIEEVLYGRTTAV